MQVAYNNVTVCPTQKNRTARLKETIAADCEYWRSLKNVDTMIDDFMYLNECEDSKQSGMYQLILNGKELYWGTLQEINAVVKTMIKLLERAEDFDL